MLRIGTAFLAFALQAPGHAPRNCDDAAAAFRAAQFEKSVELARRCLEKGIESSEIYQTLALACYMLQKPQEFRAYMEKAGELDPTDGVPHYHLGRFFYERKLYRDALQRFRRAIELDEENYRAYYFSGLCRQGNNEEAGAMEDFRKSIAIIERKQVRYGWPFADLGDLLVLQGDVDSGVSWSYRGTRNDPRLPYAHFVYAGALMKKDPGFEVEQALKTAIQLDPGYTQAYYLLGRYYTKSGEREKAKEAFDKFEELRKNPQPSPFGIRR